MKANEHSHVPCTHCKRSIPEARCFRMGDKPFCDLSHYLKWTRTLDAARRRPA